MERKTLIPRTIVDVEGKLAYDEKVHAWNVLRLKSDLIKEFPQLKEKTSKFSYQLAYHRTIEELEKTLKELKKKKDTILPVLMWLFKES